MIETRWDERSISAGAPALAAVLPGFLEFVGDSVLVAHNAGFDFGFLNHELEHCGRDPVCMSRMIDTLLLARSKHPGAKRPEPARPARVAGKPNLNGIWQAINTANWDIEDHIARQGPVVALGASSSRRSF